jgi:hypothetical protein
MTDQETAPIADLERRARDLGYSLRRSCREGRDGRSALTRDELSLGFSRTLSTQLVHVCQGLARVMASKPGDAGEDVWLE